jgi:hypothetical protein
LVEIALREMREMRDMRELREMCAVRTQHAMRSTLATRGFMAQPPAGTLTRPLEADP